MGLWQLSPLCFPSLEGGRSCKFTSHILCVRLVYICIILILSYIFIHVCLSMISIMNFLRDPPPWDPGQVSWKR